jgi:hypothetical protein
MTAALDLWGLVIKKENASVRRGFFYGENDFWFVAWFVKMVCRKGQGLQVDTLKPSILLEPAEGIEPTAC